MSVCMSAWLCRGARWYSESSRAVAMRLRSGNINLPWNGGSLLENKSARPRRAIVGFEPQLTSYRGNTSRAEANVRH